MLDDDTDISLGRLDRVRLLPTGAALPFPGVVIEDSCISVLLDQRAVTIPTQVTAIFRFTGHGLLYYALDGF